LVLISLEPEQARQEPCLVGEWRKQHTLHIS